MTHLGFSFPNALLPWCLCIQKSDDGNSKPSYEDLQTEVLRLKEQLAKKENDLSNKEMLAALGEQMKKVPGMFCNF
jgi:hypothetical protein